MNYGGDDPASFQEHAAKMIPGGQARDSRTMLRTFRRYSMVPSDDARATLEALIGHLLGELPRLR